ncbi:hypothetical protein ACK3TF_002688 [Chlorella vulgaris]
MQAVKDAVKSLKQGAQATHNKMTRQNPNPGRSRHHQSCCRAPWLGNSSRRNRRHQALLTRQPPLASARRARASSVLCKRLGTACRSSRALTTLGTTMLKSS